MQVAGIRKWVGNSLKAAAARFFNHCCAGGNNSSWTFDSATNSLTASCAEVSFAERALSRANTKLKEAKSGSSTSLKRAYGRGREVPSC
eukprot:4085216-Amphidinium_carterae.1